MVDYQSAMLTIIDNFLAGRASMEAFARAYQEFYIDVVPETAPLTDDQWGFFGMVHERLDWTDWSNPAGPDAEGRRYGWWDASEYLTWLRAARAEYPKPPEI
jgi:hypothetical protein